MSSFVQKTLFVFPFAILGAVVACSAAGNERSGFTPPQEQPDLIGGDSGFVQDTPDGPKNCLTETLGAEPVPLAMLLVMDRSGSMNSPTGMGRGAIHARE